MKIEIPFNEWSKERLKDGTKIATSRYKKYGNEKDYFKVDKTIYEIDFVACLPLWFIGKYLYVPEGCITESEFINVWKTIHLKRGWRKHDDVFFHAFHKIGTTILE